MIATKAIPAALILYLAGYATAADLDRIRDLVNGREYRQAIEAIGANPAGDEAAQLFALRGESHLALRSNKQAIADFQEARTRGNESQEVRYNIGIAYLFGTGIEKNINAGIKLLLDPAEQGHNPSRLALYQIYRQHRRNNQAVKWLKRSAGEGHARAQLILARNYHAGTFLRFDGYEGIRWFLKAAEGGNPIAQAELANQYRIGRHVTRNPERALKWILKSLENDNFDANYYMATMYEQGFGVEQNWAAAAYWYWRAASQQHVPSQINLGRLYLYGQGVPQDFAMARRWFEYSTALPEAKRQLALIYEHGLGVEKNLTTALQYYRDSSDGSLASRNKVYLTELLVNQNKAEIDDFYLQLDEILDPNEMNAMAWLIATDGPPRSGFSKAAVKLAQRAVDVVEHPAFLDTLAAAHGADGNFSSARKFQKRALKKLDKDSPLRAQLLEHLESYKSKMRWQIRFEDEANDGVFKPPGRTTTFTGLFTRIIQSEDRRLRGLYLDDRDQAHFAIEILIQHVESGSLPYDFRDYLLVYVKSPNQFFSPLGEKLELMAYPLDSYRFNLTEDYPNRRFLLELTPRQVVGSPAAGS